MARGTMAIVHQSITAPSSPSYAFVLASNGDVNKGGGRSDLAVVRVADHERVPADGRRGDGTRAGAIGSSDPADEDRDIAEP